jgi:hypothetical protein
MSRSPSNLDPTRDHLIITYIRAGGYPHVAAEAAGVPVAVFEDWLRRGEGPRASSRYRAFARGVRQAQAQCRLGAEVSIRNDRPLDWLKCGPGRGQPGSVGWTAPPRAESPSANTWLLLQPEVQKAIGAVLTALESTPNVRVAVAEQLAPLHSSNGP